MRPKLARAQGGFNASSIPGVPRKFCPERPTLRKIGSERTEETMKDQIRKALTAHAAWKVRLKTAVASGADDLDVARVKSDRHCDFGHWLHGSAIPVSVRETETYREISRLHAAFHEAAAQVVDLARSGKKAEAEAAIRIGGPFSRASANLDAALVRWGAAI